jgi:hypothetical protein
VLSAEAIRFYRSFPGSSREPTPERKTVHEVSHTYALEAAKDQSLFREVNERLRDLNEAFESNTRDSEFICECAHRDCVKHVTLSLADYEAIRLVPTHFLVAPASEHVFANVERVVMQSDEYWIVEKHGDAGLAAIKLDPRRRRPFRGELGGPRVLSGETENIF